MEYIIRNCKGYTFICVHSQYQKNVVIIMNRTNPDASELWREYWPEAQPYKDVKKSEPNFKLNIKK